MEHSIEISRLNKTYNKGSIKALADFSMNINKKEILMLLGPNGAGKSTLIKCICNVLLPDSGSIKYDESYLSPKIVGEEIGVVFESAQNIYGYLTVEENIKYFGYLNMLSKTYLDCKIKEYLELFEMNIKAKTPANHLSRGMQQKIAIMLAMIKNPNYLLLDEPTLGLDVFTSDKIKAIVQNISKNENKGVLITTHDMNLASDIGDRFVFINNGKSIWEGTKQGFKNIEFFIRKYDIYFHSDNVNADLLGSINAVRHCDNNYSVLINDIDLSDTILLITSSKCDIIRIEPQETSLEEIFKGLIKR